ncbi:MAG: hypothetical protein ACI8YQ_001704 [Polaribacter sp.]|jgi:hypothetical protein
MESNYLESVKKQFDYYKMLGDKTFAQLTEEELLWQYNAESNSIAVIVNHITGNMLSRWTDFLTTDGEKEWRNRDQEFEDLIKTKAQLLQRWEEGWACLFKAIASVDEENFQQLVYIRNQGHTIVEAINRQLAHYAYHIGQIVFLGKMVKGEDWSNLSIPKGDSKTYNEGKFKQEKRRGHFTDDFLDDGDAK